MSRARVLELLPELPPEPDRRDLRFPASPPTTPSPAPTSATHWTARTGRTLALGAAGITVAAMMTMAIQQPGHWPWLPAAAAARPAPAPEQTASPAAMLPGPSAASASVILALRDDTNAMPPPAVQARVKTRTVLPPPITDSGNPIRITATLAVVDPTLIRAFEALNAGDLAGAEAGYAQILSADARNADALLGLAAVELGRGRHAQAEALYLRTVDADPSNAQAHAGLLGLRGNHRDSGDESRLKTLLAAQPDQPALHFTLGNAYAADERWNDAEQQYFLACSSDPGQPDYLFNLAVSLDQLRQSRLAAEYYRLAIAAAALRPAQFDRMLATARLRALPQQVIDAP